MRIDDIKVVDGAVVPNLHWTEARKELVHQYIWAMKNRPEDFVRDRHWLTDGKSKIKLWIANGVWFLNFGYFDENTRSILEYRLTFWQRQLLDWALSRWVRSSKKKDPDEPYYAQALIAVFAANHEARRKT